MRLPDLQFASVGPARLNGPEEAVFESRQKLALVNQAQEGASTVAAARNEYQTKKAYAEYADHMAAFRKEAAKEFAVGKEKIIAWGLDDEIDVDSKDVFYRDEWYPLALQRVQDKARQEYGQKIGSPMARAAFDMEIGNHNSEVLARETEQAQREAMQEHQAMVRADIDTYMARGNWDSAVMAVNAATDLRPSEKQSMLLAITAGRDENTIRDEVQALTDKQSATGLSEYADYLRSDEASEVFSVGPEALDMWAARADATAKGIVDGSEVSTTKANKAIAAADVNYIETKIRNGEDLTVAEINQMSAAAAQRGDATHAKYLAKAWNNYIKSEGATGYLEDRDPDVYNETVSMIRDPDVPTHQVLKFFEQNRGNYTQSDSDALDKKIAERDRVVEVKGAMSPQTKLDTRLKPYGITDKDQPALKATLSAWLDNEIQVAAGAGKPLTPAEIDAKIDSIVLEYGPARKVEIVRPGLLSRDAEGNNIWEAIESRDPEMIAEVQAVLARAKLPPTQENVERVYRMLLEKDK